MRTDLARRAELVETYDDGELQLADALGYESERFRKAHRVQQFGLTGRPMPGAHGLAVPVNGRADQMALVGFENPEHRPRNLDAGEAGLYNAHGDLIYVYRRRIRIVTETVEIVADSIALTGAVAITGDITHTGDMTTSGTHLDSVGHHRNP